MKGFPPKTHYPQRRCRRCNVLFDGGAFKRKYCPCCRKSTYPTRERLLLGFKQRKKRLKKLGVI